MFTYLQRVNFSHSRACDSGVKMILYFDGGWFGFVGEQCGGAQSLDIAQFQKMMKDLEPYIHLWNESRRTEITAAAGH